MNALQLEFEIERMARAMMTRNREIGHDLITDLRTKLSLEDVAGVIFVSIERVIWFDPDSVFWTIANLIPTDVMAKVQHITSMAMCKQLIAKGFQPGRDFSTDSNGKMLLNHTAKQYVLPNAAVAYFLNAE